MPENLRAKVDRNKREASSSRGARYNPYARPTQQGSGQAQGAVGEATPQGVITAEKGRGGSRDRGGTYRGDRGRGGTQSADRGGRGESTQGKPHVTCWFCNKQGHVKQECHSHATREL